MKVFAPAFKVFLSLTIIVGALYPFAITTIGHVLWPNKAFGSLIVENGKIIGSELIAQKFSQEKYFFSRPSSCDYETLPSGASNYSSTSASLSNNIEQRRHKWGEDATADLLTTSASGLDPHLSEEAILYQLKRVSQARHLTVAQVSDLKKLIEKHVEQPLWGFIGERVVNVLKLNIALDRAFP